MKFSFARVKLPGLFSTFLAVLAAFLLTLAFPDFDLWFFAWFALAPLFYAVKLEKESMVKSFILGWIFGTLFFAGSCWWLTFSFITYGGIPSALAYFLLLIICSIVGIFAAVFAAAFSITLKRFGNLAIFAAPILWTASEFLRFNLTDNNWNAIGYSQAFSHYFMPLAAFGGVYLTGFLPALFSSLLIFGYSLRETERKIAFNRFPVTLAAGLIFVAMILFSAVASQTKSADSNAESSDVVIVQANVPMSGLNKKKWLNLRQRHVELAESEISKISGLRDQQKPITVVFPESPMNFSYEDDAEFRRFIGDFARKHNAYVLFNSAEPNPKNDNYYNSAIMVDPQGAKLGQYDKIHLVPFGEFAPVPAAIKPLVPTLVGSFQYGENYNLFPVGDAQAGIMICYESHFASLSREFAKRGADVLIEMTNDGYLGNTGVLRQHLASAVFRAVETNRPVLRATNVGVTAYITERGEILNAADVYTEATRTWTVSKSDGKQTFYVRFGDWFAWLCSILSLGLLFFSFWKKSDSTIE